MDRSFNFGVSTGTISGGRIWMKSWNEQKMPEVAVNTADVIKNPINTEHLKKRLKFPLSAIAIQLMFVALLAKYSDYPDDGNSRLIRQCDLDKLSGSKSSVWAPTTTENPEVTIEPPSLSIFDPKTTTKADCSKFNDPNIEEPIVVFGPPYQDTQFFIVTGLALLFMAIRSHNMSSLMMCMFILAVCLQWAFLMRGLLRLHKLHPIKPSPDVFVITLFFAAAVMISYAVILGRVSPMQVLVMCMLEIPAATANDYLLLDVLHVNDPGGTMIYNMFGTYFGLGACWALHRAGEGPMDEKRASTPYTEMLAYIGTTICWSFWPTGMGAIFTGSTRVRCILNTYFSLTGSGIIGIVFSSLLDRRGKFSNPHIQNAILAGAVAMSGAADTMMGLHGAVCVGMSAGIISVFTWVYIQPILTRRLGIVDSCGSHTLHGTPAVFGAIVSAITASMANQETYGSSLYSLFPMMAPPNNSTELDRIQEVWPDVKAGQGRSASVQAWYQILGMVVTFMVAVLSGIITGFVMRQNIFDPLTIEEYYDDKPLFNMPEQDEVRRPLQLYRKIESCIKSCVAQVADEGAKREPVVTTRF